MKIGYARVSTQEQSTAVQQEKLAELGCTRTYFEQVSGKSSNRPELEKLLEVVREGDEVIVVKLDRLARNVSDALMIADKLRERGCGLRVMDIDGQDINSTTGRLIYTVMASIAEFERGRMLERQAEGISKAKVEGKHLGRPKTVDDKKIRKYLKDGLNQTQIAKVMGISRSTVKRALSNG